MTGKTFTFIQTTQKDVVGKLLLVKNCRDSLKSQPLKDNEILIYKGFSKQNHLKIGNTYVFLGHKLLLEDLQQMLLQQWKIFI